VRENGREREREKEGWGERENLNAENEPLLWRSLDKERSGVIRRQ
jgi:hypothetical protein